MKAIACALALLSTTAWADFAAPPGLYQGTGQLIHLKDGSKISYKASYRIEDGAITASFAAPDGSVASLTFTLAPTSSGQFDLTLDHSPAGSGFCLGRSCQLNTSFPLNGEIQNVAMTFTYTPNCESILIVVSGKNATGETAFEDIVKR